MRLVCALALAALPLPAEWTAAAYLGGASVSDTSLYVRQPSLGTDVRFRDIQYRARSFESPLYYGVRAGYFFSRHFGADIELVHAKAYANTLQPVEATGTIGGAAVSGRIPPARTLDSFSLSHGLNFLLANFGARYDFLTPPNRQRGPITIIGRAGAGPTIPHVEAAFQGVAIEEYQLGTLAIQLAGGFELQLWRNLNALVEYKYTRTNERLDVPFGRAESLLCMHHGVFGLAWHF